MTKYKNFYTFISYFLLAAAGLLLDQVSKAWAVAALKPVRSVVVIDNILSLTYRENTGAAFSILEEHTEFLTVVTILVTVVISYIVISGKITNSIAEYSLVFVAIGGVGNCIDHQTEIVRIVLDLVNEDNGKSQCTQNGSLFRFSYSYGYGSTCRLH